MNEFTQTVNNATDLNALSNKIWNNSSDTKMRTNLNGMTLNNWNFNLISEYSLVSLLKAMAETQVSVIEIENFKELPEKEQGLYVKYFDESVERNSPLVKRHPQFIVKHDQRTGMYIVRNDSHRAFTHINENEIKKEMFDGDSIYMSNVPESITYSAYTTKITDYRDTFGNIMSVGQYNDKVNSLTVGLEYDDYHSYIIPSNISGSELSEYMKKMATYVDFKSKWQPVHSQFLYTKSAYEIKVVEIIKPTFDGVTSFSQYDEVTYKYIFPFSNVVHDYVKTYKLKYASETSFWNDLHNDQYNVNVRLPNNNFDAAKCSLTISNVTVFNSREYYPIRTSDYDKIKEQYAKDFNELTDDLDSFFSVYNKRVGGQEVLSQLEILRSNIHSIDEKKNDSYKSISFRALNKLKQLIIDSAK